MVLVCSISFDYCSITMGLLSMNGLVVLLLIFLLPASYLYSQGDVIADDNFSIQIDKTAHFTTSFGLYFMFHTMYSDSLLPMLSDSIPIPLHSMISATAVGFIYEVYQSTPHSKSDGFSYHDMVYNIIGNKESE